MVFSLTISSLFILHQKWVNAFLWWPIIDPLNKTSFYFQRSKTKKLKEFYCKKTLNGICIGRSNIHNLEFLEPSDQNDEDIPTAENILITFWIYFSWHFIPPLALVKPPQQIMGREGFTWGCRGWGGRWVQRPQGGRQGQDESLERR